MLQYMNSSTSPINLLLTSSSNETRFIKTYRPLSDIRSMEYNSF